MHGGCDSRGTYTAELGEIDGAEADLCTLIIPANLGRREKPKRKEVGVDGRCFWEGGAHVSLAEEISRLDTFGWMLVNLHGIGFAFIDYNEGELCVAVQRVRMCQSFRLRQKR